MKTTLRAIGAILAGAIAWGVLWNLGTGATLQLFPELVSEGMPTTHTGILIAYVGYSAGLSLLAGWITGVTAAEPPMLAVGLLAALQMSLGLAFQISYWSLMPVWYHLIFLALIIPVTLYGGVLALRRRVSRRAQPQL